MKSKVMGLVKKLAVEFIIIIFIMGFLSASLQNYLLPKVEITYPAVGYITRTVPIYGKIVPKDSKKLKLANNAVIDEMLAFYGQRITPDTRLFKIKGEYENLDNSLEELRAELKILEKNLAVYSISDEAVLNKKIKEAKDKLAFETGILNGYKDMYKEGAISKNTLLEKEMTVGRLKGEVTTLTSSKSENSLNVQIRKDETNLKIDRIKTQIENLEKLDEYYLRVDEDNICYSDVDGIITGVYDASKKNDTVFDVASLKDFSTVNYIAYVDVEYKDDVKPGRPIKLYRDSVNLNITCIIRSVSQVMKDGKLKVIADFPTGTTGIPTLNAGYDGKVERRKKVKQLLPIYAVMPHDKLLPNRKATVYAVEEKKGVLSTVYMVKELTVNIEDVGDDRIEVSGAQLGSKKEYKGIVTNISNKIYDGVRVYSEEF